MQAPLEMIAFNDDAALKFAIAASLKLGTDVDENRATAHRVRDFVRLEAAQVRPCIAEKSVESIVRVTRRPTCVRNSL